MKRCLRWLTVLLILMPAATAATHPAQGDDKATAPQRASFCDLASNPKRYDGQLVVTEAVVANSYRAMVLFDPLCSPPASADGSGYAQPAFPPPYKLGSGPDKQFRKALNHDGDVRILLVGVVESSRDAYGLDSRPFQIDIRYFVSIFRVSPAESQVLAIGPERR